MESLVFKDLLSEHSGIDTFHSDYYILIFYNYIILVELAFEISLKREKNYFIDWKEIKLYEIVRKLINYYCIFK